MDTKRKIVILLLSMITLTAFQCDEEECDMITESVKVDGLMRIIPMQSVYSKGDIITLKVDIPSTNDYFGEELNLLELTNDYTPNLADNSFVLFSENPYFFIKGGEEVQFNFEYNSLTLMYELEINITLNRLGTYSLNEDYYVIFRGDRGCVKYRLDTNIFHDEPGPGTIEFTVE